MLGTGSQMKTAFCMPPSSETVTWDWATSDMPSTITFDPVPHKPAYTLNTSLVKPASPLVQMPKLLHSSEPLQVRVHDFPSQPVILPALVDESRFAPALVDPEQSKCYISPSYAQSAEHPASTNVTQPQVQYLQIHSLSDQPYNPHPVTILPEIVCSQSSNVQQSNYCQSSKYPTLSGCVDTQSLPPIQSAYELGSKYRTGNDYLKKDILIKSEDQLPKSLLTHQWDIKDIKLPKATTFDPYELWPTGHCRRIYSQTCERARRHQSGWAMRNTNNHNPQVLKKSCLGVLECSAGCVVQGKTLSLRPAICDKARRKQTNRPCVTPGCPGRLILRNCRGHSGYPVTHFWRFANGAVYFESKGEHDHNRPSLKTFGFSESYGSLGSQPLSTATDGATVVSVAAPIVARSTRSKHHHHHHATQHVFTTRRLSEEGGHTDSDASKTYANTILPEVPMFQDCFGLHDSEEHQCSSTDKRKNIVGHPKEHGGKQETIQMTTTKKLSHSDGKNDRSLIGTLVPPLSLSTVVGSKRWRRGAHRKNPQNAIKSLLRTAQLKSEVFTGASSTMKPTAMECDSQPQPSFQSRIEFPDYITSVPGEQIGPSSETFSLDPYCTASSNFCTPYGAISNTTMSKADHYSSVEGTTAPDTFYNSQCCFVINSYPFPPSYETLVSRPGWLTSENKGENDSGPEVNKRLTSSSEQRSSPISSTSVRWSSSASSLSACSGTTFPSLISGRAMKLGQCHVDDSTKYYLGHETECFTPALHARVYASTPEGQYVNEEGTQLDTAFSQMGSDTRPLPINVNGIGGSDSYMSCKEWFQNAQGDVIPQNFDSTGIRHEVSQNPDALSPQWTSTPAYIACCPHNPLDKFHPGWRWTEKQNMSSLENSQAINYDTSCPEPSVPDSSVTYFPYNQAEEPKDQTSNELYFIPTTTVSSECSSSFRWSDNSAFSQPVDALPTGGVYCSAPGVDTLIKSEGEEVLENSIPITNFPQWNSPECPALWSHPAPCLAYRDEKGCGYNTACDEEKELQLELHCHLPDNSSLLTIQDSGLSYTFVPNAYVSTAPNLDQEPSTVPSEPGFAEHVESSCWFGAQVPVACGINADVEPSTSDRHGSNSPPPLIRMTGTPQRRNQLRKAQQIN
ncbi:unnamed protein product [Calicophoron daubneyi]|uniref:GCM domain-containing protein n=1 Tax=Calicophoron daubneyi TaxID=300641 RepID=A0AAV2TKF4_CALDB